MTSSEVLFKAIKVLNSCESKEQFMLACNYCCLAEKHLNDVDKAVLRTVAVMGKYSSVNYKE